MALLILSRDTPELKETMSVMQEVAKSGQFRLVMNPEQQGEKRGVEFYIEKYYGNEQAYMYFLFSFIEELRRTYELHDLQFDGRKYYRIGVTDQAKYDRLIYEFSLAYLRLRPDQRISLYGDVFMSLHDLEKVEKTGYNENWQSFLHQE